MAVSSDVKLYCYNEALRLMKERKLSSLSEAREPRRVLDSAWGDGNEGVLFCLEQHDWNFATRTLKLEPDPALETGFGFQNVYNKPTDMVRLTTISADEYYRIPLTHHQYRDEAEYYLTDINPLYLRYVSDGDDYGLNSGAWTPGFKKFVAAYLAKDSASRITGDKDTRQEVEFNWREKLAHAESRDEQSEGVKFPTPGSWVRSRLSSSGMWRRDDR